MEPSASGSGNGVDLRVGKYGASIWGQQTLIIVVLSLAIGSFVYFDWRGHAERRNEHERILRAQEQFLSELEFQSWLQSIPPDKRPRVLMPYGAERRLYRPPSPQDEERANR